MDLKRTIISFLFLLLTGCQTIDRLWDAGDLPPLTQIQNPVSHPNYRPVTMPMPTPIQPEGGKNSLWQVGARGFFKEQRANKVGDILTVSININDQASVTSNSARARTSTEKVGVDNFLGMETFLPEILPSTVDAKKLIGISSSPTHTGTGTVTRQEKINMTLAATVVQILPNGNFVISGRQEMRVNYEIRELLLTGIVRPEDISSANSIPYDKIAEVRMSYGGRGQIDDMQQPPLGQQIVDLISPI